MNTHGKGDRRNNWLLEQTFYLNNNLMFIDGIVDQYNSNLDKWFKHGQAQFTRPGKSYKFGSVTIITKKDLKFSTGTGTCKFGIYGKNNNNWIFLDSFKVGANPTNSNEYADQTTHEDNRFIRITKYFNNSNFYYSYMLRNIEVDENFIDSTDNSLCDAGHIIEIEWGNFITRDITTYTFIETNTLYEIGSHSDVKYITNANTKLLDTVTELNSLIKLQLQTPENQSIILPPYSTISYKLDNGQLIDIAFDNSTNETTLRVPLHNASTCATLNISTPNLSLDPYNPKWSDYPIKPPFTNYQLELQSENWYAFPRGGTLVSPTKLPIGRSELESREVELHMKFDKAIPSEDIFKIYGEFYKKDKETGNWGDLVEKVDCDTITDHNDTLCLKFTLDDDVDYLGYFIFKLGDYYRYQKWELNNLTDIYTYPEGNQGLPQYLFINQQPEDTLTFFVKLNDEDILGEIESITEDEPLIINSYTYHDNILTIKFQSSVTPIDINFTIKIKNQNHLNNIIYDIPYSISAQKQINPSSIMSNANTQSNNKKLEYWTSIYNLRRGLFSNDLNANGFVASINLPTNGDIYWNTNQPDKGIVLQYSHEAYPWNNPNKWNNPMAYGTWVWRETEKKSFATLNFFTTDDADDKDNAKFQLWATNELILYGDALLAHSRFRDSQHPHGGNSYSNSGNDSNGWTFIGDFEFKKNESHYSNGAHTILKSDTLGRFDPFKSKEEWISQMSNEKFGIWMIYRPNTDYYRGDVNNGTAFFTPRLSRIAINTDADDSFWIKGDIIDTPGDNEKIINKYKSQINITPSYFNPPRTFPTFKNKLEFDHLFFEGFTINSDNSSITQDGNALSGTFSKKSGDDSVIIIDNLSITSTNQVTITIAIDKPDDNRSFQVYIPTSDIVELSFNPEITNSATSYLLQYSPNYKLPNTITIKDAVFSNFNLHSITITQNDDIRQNDAYTFYPETGFKSELSDDTITINHLLLYNDNTTVTFTIDLREKNDNIKYNDYSFVFDILGTDIEEIRFNPQITNPDINTNTYPSPSPKLLYRNESDNPFENTLIIQENNIFIDVNKHVNVDIERTNTKYSLIIQQNNDDYKITIPSIVIPNKDSSVILKIYYDNSEYDITILPEDIEIVSPNHIFSTFKLPPMINDNWTSKTLDSDGNEGPPKKIFESLRLSPNKQEIIWDNNMNLSPTNYPNVNVGFAINHIFSSDSTVIISYDQGDDKEFGLVIGKTIDIDDFVGTATNFELYSSTYSGWNSIIQYHNDTDNRNENYKYLYAFMGRGGGYGGIDLYDDTASYAVQPPSGYSNQNKANSEGWLGSNGGFGDYRHHIFDIKEKHIKQYVKFERKDGQMRINYSNELSSGYKENDYVTKMRVINPEEEEYLVMMKFNLKRESLPITQWPKIEKIPSLRNVIYDLHPESQRYVNRSLLEADKQNISFNLVGSFKSWSLSKEVSFNIKNFVGDNAKKNKTFFKVYMTVNDNTTEQIVSANFFHKDITNQTDRNLMKQGFNIPDEDLDLQYIVVDSNEQEISDGLLEVLLIKQHYNGNLFPTINGKCTLKRIDIYNSIVIDRTGDYNIKLNQKESYIQPIPGFLITPVYSTYPATTNYGSLEEPDSSTHNIALNEWKPHSTGGSGGSSRATVINYIFRSDYCIITSFKNKAITAGIIYKRGLSLAPDIYTGATSAATGVIPAIVGFTGFKNNYLVIPSAGYFDPHRIYGGILNNNGNHIFIKFERIGNYTAIYTSDKNSELMGPNDPDANWSLVVSNSKTLGIESCIQIGIRNTPLNSVDPTNLKIIYASFVPFNPIISNSDEVAISYTGNNKAKLLYGNNFSNSLKIEDKNLFTENNKQVTVTVEGDGLTNVLHTVNVSDGVITIPSIILNDNSIVRLNIEYNGTNFAINIPEDEIAPLYVPYLNNVDASKNTTKLLVGSDYENTITIQEVNYFVEDTDVTIGLSGSGIGDTVTPRTLTIDNDNKIIIDKIILTSKSDITINIQYNNTNYNLIIAAEDIKDLNNGEGGLVVSNTNFSGGIPTDDGVRLETVQSELETVQSEMFGWTNYENVWKIKSSSQSWIGSGTPSPPLVDVQNEYLIGLHNNDTSGNECSISTKYYNTISGDSYVLSWWQQNQIGRDTGFSINGDFQELSSTLTYDDFTSAQGHRILLSDGTIAETNDEDIPGWTVSRDVLDDIDNNVHITNGNQYWSTNKTAGVHELLIRGCSLKRNYPTISNTDYTLRVDAYSIKIDQLNLSGMTISVRNANEDLLGDKLQVINIPFHNTTTYDLVFNTGNFGNNIEIEIYAPKDIGYSGTILRSVELHLGNNVTGEYQPREISISLGDTLTLIAPYKTISNSVAGEWEERIISFKASDTSSTIKFTSRGILGLPPSIGTAYISNVKFEKNSITDFEFPSDTIELNKAQFYLINDPIEFKFTFSEQIYSGITTVLSVNDGTNEDITGTIDENRKDITYLYDKIKKDVAHTGIIKLNYGSIYGSLHNKPIEQTYFINDLLTVNEIFTFPSYPTNSITNSNLLKINDTVNIESTFSTDISNNITASVILTQWINDSPVNIEPSPNVVINGNKCNYSFTIQNLVRHSVALSLRFIPLNRITNYITNDLINASNIINFPDTVLNSTNANKSVVINGNLTAVTFKFSEEINQGITAELIVMDGDPISSYNITGSDISFEFLVNQQEKHSGKIILKYEIFSKEYIVDSLIEIDEFSTVYSANRIWPPDDRDVQFSTATETPLDNDYSLYECPIKRADGFTYIARLVWKNTTKYPRSYWYWNNCDPNIHHSHQILQTFLAGNGENCHGRSMAYTGRATDRRVGLGITSSYGTFFSDKGSNWSSYLGGVNTTVTAGFKKRVNFPGFYGGASYIGQNYPNVLVDHDTWTIFNDMKNLFAPVGEKDASLATHAYPIAERPYYGMSNVYLLDNTTIDIEGYWIEIEFPGFIIPSALILRRTDVLLQRFSFVASADKIKWYRLIYKSWVHWGSPGYSSYSEKLEFPIEERPSNMNYFKYFRILIGITDRNYTIGYNFNIRQSSGTIDLSNVPDVYFGTPPYA